MRNSIRRGMHFLFILGFIAFLGGLGYLGYYLIHDEGWYDLQGRWNTKDLEKTTFTYYFFWYDNKSGEDARLASQIYNDPTKFAPSHPYYMTNASLLNKSVTIPAQSALIYNVTQLQQNHENFIDFDMMQTILTDATASLTVFGLNSSDYEKYEEDPGQSVKRWGTEVGTHLFHRLQYRLQNLPYLVIENNELVSVDAHIEFTIHNDSLSHHPDSTKFTGDFSYRNVEWHKYEIKNIIQAGIDVILPVYWGSWSGEFNTIGLPCFVDAMEELELELGLDALPKIGMFMDTTALMTYLGVKPDLTAEANQSIFAQFINEFFTIIPERFCFRVNNADLVWMYGSNFVTDYDDDVFQYARTQYKTQFGTDHDLIYVGVGWTEKARASQFGAYSWGVSLFGEKVVEKGIKIGCVGPGFYSEGAYRYGWQWSDGIRIRDRENGANFINGFRNIMGNSKWIVIEVWNEYHEGNDISYTEEYGDLYMNLTHDLIQEFKATPYSDWREFDTYFTIGLGVGIISILGLVYVNTLKKKVSHGKI
jgi:hypothetical protein